MMNKVLKFPTRAKRKAYKKKLFSLKSTIDILIVTIGVLLADVIFDLAKYLIFKR